VFDISFASVDKIWKFDGSQTNIPSKESVAASVSKINYQNIIIDKEKSTVFLKEKGMKIGFGAIGKGYAANKAKAKMIAIGVKDGVVNAGGDLITWGKMEHGGDWSIGIANPKEKDEIMGWLIINDFAVVTSGNYEKFFIVNGKKYTHIINPKTGYPATGTKSVTIVCKDAELSDALATSVFILGAKKGIELINRLKNIECLVVTAQNELQTSKGLKLNYYKENASSPSDNIKTVK
jgi:thiamine biosynthesis lipoprotein